MGRIERMGWLNHIPYICLGLLALMPLLRMVGLNWIEYGRLWLITLGLGYLLWRYLRGSGDALGKVATIPWVLLSLAFVFILSQFGRIGEGLFWVPVVLSAGTFAVLLPGGQLRWTWCWLDWVAIGVWILLMVASAGVSWVLEASISWRTWVHIATSALLWFAVTRAGVARPAWGRKLAWGVLAVFALVSTVGAAQWAGVFFYENQGQKARREEDLQAAVKHLQRALWLSNRLELERAQNEIAFDLAGVLFAQEKEDEAAEILGLRKGFFEVVRAHAWKGPVGGNLYYMVSCWKDLELLPGLVEIQVYARGEPALGVWPLMQVKLGDEILGKVTVAWEDTRPYSFLVQVGERSRKRLEIAFLNDIHRKKPRIDRNLKVDKAEIHYRRIQWK